MDAQAKYITGIVAENKQLKEENNHLKEELAETKIMLFNLQKNTLPYTRGVRKSKIGCAVSWDCDIDLPTKLERSKCTRQLRFENHKNKLGEETLEIIRRMNESKQKDSTFVLKCMKKIVDVGALPKLSACGKKRNRSKKKLSMSCLSSD